MFNQRFFQLIKLCLLVSLNAVTVSCNGKIDQTLPTLHWYVFDEPSGAFREAAANCSKSSRGKYAIEVKPLPTDADQQREQLVRRLAAKDGDIDLIGMDVIWTAEFAEAGWILPWSAAMLKQITEGRLPAAVETTRYKNQHWAIPFTSNAQLLWYRQDRDKYPPQTWQQLLANSETKGNPGDIQIQGQRYEGLTVFFISLLASAGGAVLEDSSIKVSLADKPTIKTLTLMKRLATSRSSDPALATAREDQNRLAFETGKPTYMVNYSYVWPSAQQNAPDIAAEMAYSRWPAIEEGRPSRVTIGGLNIGIGAYTHYPEFAFTAAECLAGKTNQILAAEKGGLPPTLEALYDAPEVRKRFPFADVLRTILRDAVLRPPTPVYNDISLAISRTLHPMRDIQPEKDVVKLREAVQRALNSEGLL